MGLVPEDRASARSDEPEARSAARWRERAAGAPRRTTSRGGGLRSGTAARGPVASGPTGPGRSPRTVRLMRGRSWIISSCASRDVDVAAGRADIAGYVRDLRERPGRRGANVVSLTSGVGLANATLQLRVTVIRLFYDFLVEGRIRGRTRLCVAVYAADGRAGGVVWWRVWIALPWIPTDAQWRAVLEVAAGESLRNRLMLALAYDAAFRREELCLRRPMIWMRRIERSRCGRRRRRGVGPGRAVLGGRGTIARRYCARRQITTARGALFVSESPRNRGAGVSRGRGRRWCGRSRCAAGVPAFSTHTLRHLCLTDLARSGWEIGQIASFAGHRSNGHDPAVHPSVRPRSRCPA